MILTCTLVVASNGDISFRLDCVDLLLHGTLVRAYKIVHTISVHTSACKIYKKKLILYRNYILFRFKERMKDIMGYVVECQ